MTLSRRAKESIKTALAMTIAYAVSLYMDWDKPMWAGFAVAFVSLNSVGQSIDKAALRMVGTFGAIVAAFILLGLFSQERWLFMFWLSAWLGICTYLMGGARHQYFWQVCGFVCVIICMDGGADSSNAFEIAMLRAQQTGLGIFVYGLVSILVWPVSSGPQFRQAATKLAAAQSELFRCYVDLMNGEKGAEEAHNTAVAEAQARAGVGQIFEAAQTDDYGIWERRGEWRQYQLLSSELEETLERWREALSTPVAADLTTLIPGLPAFTAEVSGRLDAIASMLADNSPSHEITDCDLHVARDRAASLSHFNRAALTVNTARLIRIDELSRELYECVSRLKGWSPPVELPAVLTKPPRELLVLDADRAISAIRVMATFWLAVLTYFYVEDLPGGPVFVSFAAPLAMILATMPQLAVSQLYKPTAVGVLIGSYAYIFIMPHLSTFLGLGALIFLLTFAICYVYAAPLQILGRAFGLAMFMAIASIDNDQTYNFLVAANTALMLPSLLLVLGVGAHIPVSARPEQNFLRLLGRFFRSCKVLAATLREGAEGLSGRKNRMLFEYHAREIATLPQKLTVWTKFMGPDSLRGTSPAQLQRQIGQLRSISRGMAELREEHAKAHNPVLVDELGPDFRAWRLTVTEGFDQLAANPAAGGREIFLGRVDEIARKIETRIAAVVDGPNKNEITEQDAIQFYRLLGAYRGMSESLVRYAGVAEDVDWVEFRRERFA